MKLLGITCSRAEYDLMSGLYMRLHADPDVELKLLVAGSHLSPTFGRSVQAIRQDGLDILLTLETLLDADSRVSRLKSASLLLQNSIDLVAHYDPDLILYAGDREEVIIGGLLGAYLEIPTCHFFGGDHSQDGHVDHMVRHATSKLSTVHMVSLPQHAQRLLKMGEAPQRVHQIGSIALDKFVRHQPAELAAIHAQLGIQEGFTRYALVIFHPVAEEKAQAHHYFENILLSLKKRNIPALVSAPNADEGFSRLLEVVEHYRGDPHFHFYRNLERALFLSVYKRCDFLIGNSSSGIIEAASIPIPVINVGLRQRGRLAGANVHFCDPHPEALDHALEQVAKPAFQNSLKGLKNPYGDGQSEVKAHQLIRSLDFKALRLKREDILSL
ncbi:UDP-N-acetylglucosamine 2-epimerase [Magnetococcus marinus MC-1]|uniref:UDP-N-acetylglucosamine 2-epimerase n=1 Tax=Magnetococcus marinus (strain ATCC BAA-1437 / JCM 17883 / MC-1) TaxID=156889 RepID=A0L543_MAGMM|nr:UDP-N-acetylglucosamine 2-epimerase [Magnetococcus marinus]ABK43086.1 UDP-N-acetylglucosamine 2-epimerase [Magnetococcus marinus MC-1]